MLTNSYAYAELGLPDKITTRQNDAANQMNRLTDYLQRERTAKELEESRNKKTSKVEGSQSADNDNSEGAEIKLELKQLVTDPSVVLKEEEINSITKDYVGRKVNVKELYEAVGRINDLYQQKGYVTCRAFLLQQTIENGTVKITLIEGKTGDVIVQNNKSTKASYIKNRVYLAKDEVANINKLNQDLLRFNATNDVQLRIVMQPGQKSGTTDYVITAFEPRQNVWNVLIDNAGNESSGKFREGVFFTAKSLSGDRDSLMIGNINSEGTKAVTSSYSRSLGHSGTKLNISYNTNSVKTIKGTYKDLIKGHSNAVNVGIIQPWIINDKTRSEAIFELNHQKSVTDFLQGNIRIVDDKVLDAFAGFAMTNYGKSHVFYQKHGFTYGKYDSNPQTGPEKENYLIFKSNGFYQRAYQHGQSITARGDFQWANKDSIISSRQYYIGGINTVRGYEENLRGADNGFNLSVEYAVPLNVKRTVNAYTFFDYGQLFGEDAQSTNANNKLYSTGVGIRANITKNIYCNMAVGIPLKKHFDAGLKEPSSAKLHLTINGQF